MKRIILAGGGHGHINILKNLIKNSINNFEIILITDYKRQYYSGMLAAFIEGIYSEDDISFDVAKLCKMANVRYIEEKITAIDKANQKVVTKVNEYSYDYLSINLGSSSKVNFPIDSPSICLVKPIKNVVDAKVELSSLAKTNPNLKIRFVGGGASGIELALAFRSAFPKSDISIITSKDILSNFNNHTKSKLENIFKEKSIKIIKGERVSLIKDKKIYTNKFIYDFDFAFVTAGFHGPHINFDGFNTRCGNFIVVDENLFADKNVLAMGDVANLKKYPSMTKAGVFAIHQARVLYQNLLKLMKKQRNFISYQPQKNYLQIINCGDRTALANYGNFSLFGKLPWKLKDKIDRDYMKI